LRIRPHNQTEAAAKNRRCSAKPLNNKKCHHEKAIGQFGMVNSHPVKYRPPLSQTEETIDLG